MLKFVYGLSTASKAHPIPVIDWTSLPAYNIDKRHEQHLNGCRIDCLSMPHDSSSDVVEILLPFVLKIAKSTWAISVVGMPIRCGRLLIVAHITRRYAISPVVCMAEST
jgi:hypothetical protein